MTATSEPERELRVGDSFPLELVGRSGAGYRWSFTIDDPHVVSVARVLDTDVPFGSAPGDPHAERFVIAGHAAGTTVVRFSLARVFEPEKAPLERHDVVIRVR